MEQTPIQKYVLKMFSDCIMKWLLGVASERKGVKPTLCSKNHPMQGMPIETVGFCVHQYTQHRDIHPKCLVDGHNYQSLIKWIWHDHHQCKVEILSPKVSQKAWIPEPHYFFELIHFVVGNQ